MLKLGARLAKIDSMVSGRWQHIWDCCCDHGHLGMRLLARDVAQTVHFVDVVPELTTQVEETLRHFRPRNEYGQCWRVHCQDVARLKLADDTDSQLVILAGVGGDLMIDLVKGLLDVNAGKHLELILCPVRQQHRLRVTMAQVGLSLVDEKLVEENRRYYEVLHLTTGEGASISPVGSVMWDFSQPSHQRYLATVIAHYQRMAQKPDVSSGVREALDCYSALQVS